MPELLLVSNSRSDFPTGRVSHAVPMERSVLKTWKPVNYVIFWKILKYILYNAYIAAFQTGSDSNLEQNRRVYGTSFC